jgi:RHS repeat-associated protein
LNNRNGQSVASYSYEAFGQKRTFTGSADNDFLYTGRQLDSESGLYYYRNRYYSPSVGRFITKDPIGMRGGINYYSYVLNNAINATDPFGLEYTVAKVDTPLGTYFIKRETVERYTPSPSRVLGTGGRILQAIGLKSAGNALSTAARVCDTGGTGRLVGAIVVGATGAKIGGATYGPVGAVVGGVGGAIAGGIVGGTFDSPDAGNLY